VQLLFLQRFERLKPLRQIITPRIVLTVVTVFCLLIAVWQFSLKGIVEQQQTNSIIAEPKINDIIFLDARLIETHLRPKDYYRLAKIVDITGDVISITYGSFYYPNKRSVLQSIKYGQLAYRDYFDAGRVNINYDELVSMRDNGAIYLAKRPERNKLFGRIVGPEVYSEMDRLFGFDTKNSRGDNLIYGKKENIAGEGYLANQYSEVSLKAAYQLFLQSAQLGYDKGMVNLATMYIDGTHADRNLEQALHWLKQASLQSNKTAIYKYVIVCQQVDNCSELDFYQSLYDAGVNIKVKNINFTLDK